jgi:hypothetical protein
VYNPVAKIAMPHANTCIFCINFAASQETFSAAPPPVRLEQDAPDHVGRNVAHEQVLHGRHRAAMLAHQDAVLDDVAQPVVLALVVRKFDPSRFLVWSSVVARWLRVFIRGA